MGVLVFIDNQKGKIVKASFEAMNYGAQIASARGENVTALTYGNLSDSDAAELGKNGADKILNASSLSEMLPHNIAKLIIDTVNAESADLIITSHEHTGKSIAPIVSAKLNAGLVAGAIELPNENDGFVVKKAVFSGKAFAYFKVLSDKKIISLLPNSVAKIAFEKSPSVQQVSADVSDSRLKIKAIKVESSDSLPLPEAELVVSAGRGLKGPEHWGIIEDLAKELNAATACSRPVSDIGWRPHHEHVGQTGIAIRPNLYIAIGISGAIQHLAGVNGSKTIVVINKDPEAPFFKAADYGIVGDAFEIIPKLTAAVKEFKASQN